jgi:hypothetical protein
LLVSGQRAIGNRMTTKAKNILTAIILLAIVIAFYVLAVMQAMSK